MRLGFVGIWIFALSISVPVNASSINWNGFSSNLWSVGANWAGGVAPNGPSGTNIAVFGAGSTVFNPIYDAGTGANDFLSGLTIGSQYNLTIQNTLAVTGTNGFNNSGTLTLDAGSGLSQIEAGGTNNGTIQFAPTGGTTSGILFAGTLNNAGGTINTANAPTDGFELVGGTITGGTISGPSSTQTVLIGATSTFSGVNNSADVTGSPTAFTMTNGTNSGTFTMNGKSTFTGVNNSGAINIVSTTGTISGGTNSGTIAVSVNGTLNLAGSIANTGGTIEGNTGGGVNGLAITLKSATITGGNLIAGGAAGSSDPIIIGVSASSTNTLSGVSFQTGSLNIGSGTTTFTAGSTIAGDGTVNLTAGTLSFTAGNTNNGALNQSGGTLSISGTLTNSGTIFLSGGTLSVNASGATISGGTFTDFKTGNGATTISGGTLSFVGVDGTLEGTISNSANLSFSATSNMVFSGFITNSGTITQAAGGTANFTGGSITGGTLSGNFGTIGTGTEFTLSGITIAPGSTLSADGGELLMKGAITNNGTLNGNDASGSIALQGATITGGTISGVLFDNSTSTLSGVDLLNADLILVHTSLKGTNIMNGGMNNEILNVTGTASLTLTGTIDNEGTIARTAGTLTLNNVTVASVNGTGVLQGNVGVTANSINSLGYGFFEAGTLTVNGASTTTLTNGLDVAGTVTVTGAGSILNLNTGLTDNGLIQSTSGGAIVLQNVYLEGSGGGGTLSGTVTAESGSTNYLDTLTLAGTFNFDGAETIITNATTSATITTSNGLTIVGGTVSNTGTITTSSTGVTALDDAAITGGTVSGNLVAQYGTADTLSGTNGTLSTLIVYQTASLNYIGNLTDSGTFNLGDPVGEGTLTVTGNYTETSDGILDVDLGATPDLSITGSAALDGTLDVILPSSFDPVYGTSYEIIDLTGAETITGAFADVILPSPYYSLVYGSNYVDVLYSASITPEPAGWMLAGLGAALIASLAARIRESAH